MSRRGDHRKPIALLTSGSICGQRCAQVQVALLRFWRNPKIQMSPDTGTMTDDSCLAKRRFVTNCHKARASRECCCQASTDARRSSLSFNRCGQASPLVQGKHISTVKPPSERLRILMVPPWTPAARLAIARPIPKPDCCQYLDLSAR